MVCKCKLGQEGIGLGREGRHGPVTGSIAMHSVGKQRGALMGFAME